MPIFAPLPDNDKKCWRLNENPAIGVHFHVFISFANLVLHVRRAKHAEASTISAGG